MSISQKKINNLSRFKKGSQSRLGAVLSEETKDKISKSLTGKKQSKKTRIKRSKAQMGNKNHFYGKRHKKESIEKIIKNRKGKNVGKNHQNYGKTGKRSPCYKGKRIITKSGYVRLYIEKGKRVIEHRYVMEQHLGRKLSRYEQVHHRNGVKHDNRLSNLEIILVTAKYSFHKGYMKCPYCLKKFGVQ